jgi:hypothetical protein
MRELESSSRSFGEFPPEIQLARPTAAPYFVRWVRQFLSRPISDECLADQVRRFYEESDHVGWFDDWSVQQANHALRLYFLTFLKPTEWHRRPAAVADERGCSSVDRRQASPRPSPGNVALARSGVAFPVRLQVTSPL